MALIAAGWVMSCQKVPKPVLTCQCQNAAPQPWVWMLKENPCAATAAMGMRTTIER
jgi:hypothetical protein